MKNKSRIKISYEPEADILMWEITDKPIDYAKEIGNIIVHFTKGNMPVLVEILEASKFLNKIKNIVGKKEEILTRKAVLSAQ